MIHIIVVSHFHDDYIISLINKINESDFDTSSLFRIYIKDNVNSSGLRDFCAKENIHYIPSVERSGFSRNNNHAVAEIIEDHHVDIDQDYFLFLNPDVLVDASTLKRLCEILACYKYDLFTVDLYKDQNLTVRDPSVRHFPKLVNFFTSYFLGYNKSIIDRTDINSHQIVDWCAGSFLGMKCSVFKHIKGFDEQFFMYCEDIDICIRAKKAGYELVYLPEIKVVHFSQNDNRTFFSKNFIWHLKSVLYMFRKHLLKVC
ncbi:glycosyltransferase family 2 protein [Enterobacter sp. ECC-019]|uniref:glycosyltransferase family 2 protein n=1 Tax=Enterobacter sp. ECC-019 TaxID=3116478 RepID=UPI003754A708